MDGDYRHHGGVTTVLLESVAVMGRKLLEAVFGTALAAAVVDPGAAGAGLFEENLVGVCGVEAGDGGCCGRG
ncbi:hypothetical protein [Streptomyces sp. NPDC049949]|uniref:hypothetical protein n=1 Tax=Streptomyces sp. NPDC049949 TaxID=3154627 RepID=UPI00343B914C